MFNNFNYQLYTDLSNNGRLINNPDSFLSQRELQPINGEQPILAYNELERNGGYSLQELITKRPKTSENNQVIIDKSASENNQVNIDESASENNHESHQNKQTTCGQSKNSYSFSDLEKFIPKDVDIKLVCQSFEENRYLTERGRKILVHKFVDLLLTFMTRGKHCFSN